MVDRLTNRQYPRGHVEGLEAEVERLKTRIKELELEVNTFKHELDQARGQSTADARVIQGTMINIDSPNIPDQSSTSPFEYISDDFNVVPRDVTSGRRYIGDSSGLFFGKIVQAVLLQADYKGEQGPRSNSLRSCVAEHRDRSVPASSNASPRPAQFQFPDSELALKLQTAYFTCR